VSLPSLVTTLVGNINNGGLSWAKVAKKLLFPAEEDFDRLSGLMSQ